MSEERLYMHEKENRWWGFFFVCFYSEGRGGVRLECQLLLWDTASSIRGEKALIMEVNGEKDGEFSGGELWREGDIPGDNPRCFGKAQEPIRFKACSQFIYLICQKQLLALCNREPIFEYLTNCAWVTGTNDNCCSHSGSGHVDRHRQATPNHAEIHNKGRADI